MPDPFGPSGYLHETGNQAVILACDYSSCRVSLGLVATISTPGGIRNLLAHPIEFCVR